MSYKYFLKLHYTLIIVVGFTWVSCGGTEWDSVTRVNSSQDAANLDVTDGFLPLPVGSPEAYSMQIGDIRAASDFAFQTTRTAEVHISLVSDETPEENQLIQMREVRDGSAGRVLFRALTDASGEVNGNFTVVSTNNRAQLDFAYEGQVYAIPVDLENLKKLDRSIRMNPAGASSASSNAGNSVAANAAALADSDGDRVPDDADDFPDDATRVTRVMFPTEGRYTVAFEDLYPRKGDADFNDYVIQARQEEHLNSAGDVVRILGSYRHVARAAGYNHILRLSLPVPSADYTIRRSGSDGSLVSTTSHRATPFEKIDITDQSNLTIAQSNAHAGQEFLPGDLFEVDIIPDAPVAKADLGGAPYDLHIYVLNTGREIHFAGKYTNDDGTDLYLDDDGFPWALMVPIDWRWMYERQDIFAAYQFFVAWYSSAGADNADWYNYPDLSEVFGGVAGSYSSAPEFLPPPGFNPADFVIAESLRPLPVRINETYLPVGTLFEIEPLSGGSIVFPADPAEIRYTYDRDALVDAGLPENFAVFYYDVAGDAWLPVDETVVDAANETVIGRTSHLTPFVLAVNTAAAGPPVPVETQNLRSGVAGLEFGRSIVLKGDRAIVGLPGFAVAGINRAGGARIIERDASGNWQAIATLTSSNPTAFSRYGFAVALDGDYVAVTDPAAPFSTELSAVDVYERSGSGSWNRAQQLTIPGSDPLQSVAISGDYLVIGSLVGDSLVNRPQGGPGHAYVYERQANGSWSLAATLESPRVQNGNDFGQSVDISGNVIVVGAPAEDNSGRAYVFERDPAGVWRPAQTLVSSDLEFGDHFGWSVAIEGDRMIVGADFENGGPGNSILDAGAAYIFERDNAGAWNEVAALNASAAQRLDYFGWAVDIYSDYAIVGARYEDGGPGDPLRQAGAAYLIERQTDGTWIETDLLRSSDIQRLDLFAWAVSIHGRSLLIGAIGEDGGAGDPAADSGSIYVFDF